jgi:hypothetical protein
VQPKTYAGWPCLRSKEEGVMSAKIGGVVEKTTLPETSDHSPSLAFFGGRLFIAWKGSGNENLNVAFSQPLSAGVRPVFDLKRKHTSGERSDDAPTLAVHHGTLFIGWKGSGNDNLNVAVVEFLDLGGGEASIGGIVNKLTLGDTSSKAPALASHNDKLFIAWKGSGNDNLNLMYSDVVGSFRTDLKHISEETSDSAPALASHRGKLFIGWKGEDLPSHLNSAEVQFSPDGTRIAVFAPKQILFGRDSGNGPAMLSYGEQESRGVRSSLFMAFHEGGAFGGLNVIASDSGIDFKPPVGGGEISDRGPALSSNTTGPFDPGDLFIAWKGSGNENLNVARVEATVT